MSRIHGRERVSLFEVFKAIAYMVYTGCQWKMLPTYFPKHTTVYYHLRKWSETDNLTRFLHRLVGMRRRKIGRKSEPTVVVLDSQSVRSGYSLSQKGVDGFKKIKGIKRHILVDSNGLPLLCDITTANVHDSKGVDILLSDMKIYYPTVSLVKADRGYQGVNFTADSAFIECVKFNFGSQMFIPISGRWVVERTNAWLENFRRLCRNYERYLTTARKMTYLASIMFMLRYF
ncbi:MAG: IS5 family transposase [Muribaculaceae bacterium]|nr:IS5 family transposase [Muribaculaceae bacterium]